MGIAAASLAVTAASAAAQYSQGEKAADAQEKASNVEQQQQELRARRERLRMIREQRIKAAQIQAIGANTGASESSGVIGGVGSLQSQLGSNINAMQQQSELSKQISGYRQDAADAQSNANMFGTIGGVSNQVFKDYGGYTSIFGQDKKKTP